MWNRSYCLRAPELQPVFKESGFGSDRRLFLQAPLPDLRELIAPNSVVRNIDELPPALPDNLKLRRWTAPAYQPAADLIHRAYAYHGDTAINDQYRTVQGCFAFCTTSCASRVAASSPRSTPLCSPTNAPANCKAWS